VLSSESIYLSKQIIVIGSVSNNAIASQVQDLTQGVRQVAFETLISIKFDCDCPWLTEGSKGMRMGHSDHSAAGRQVIRQ